MYNQRWFIIKESKESQNNFCFIHDTLSKDDHLYALIHAIYFTTYISNNRKENDKLVLQNCRAENYPLWSKLFATVAAVSGAVAGGAYYYGHQTAAVGFSLCAAAAGSCFLYLLGTHSARRTRWKNFCAKGNAIAKADARKKLLERDHLKSGTINEIEAKFWPSPTKRSEE